MAEKVKVEAAASKYPGYRTVFEEANQNPKTRDNDPLTVSAQELGKLDKLAAKEKWPMDVRNKIWFAKTWVSQSAKGALPLPKDIKNYGS